MDWLTALFSHLNEFEVEEVEIKLPRLPRQFSGFRIVQISDLHMGGWMNGERLRKVVDMVKQQHPDLVVITGDFFNGPVWDENLTLAAEELVEEAFPADSGFYDPRCSG